MINRVNVIIICYAIDDRDSFDEVDDWIDMVRDNNRADPAPIALLGTKKDLEGERKIPKSYGMKKKEGIDGCFYFAEVSVNEEYEGLKKKFKDIARHIVNESLYTEQGE